MTSANTAIIRNGFVFIPASSFNRDDRGDEDDLPHEIGAEPNRALNMPALSPEQQQVLRMAYDANSTPESHGGMDGLWIDVKTAVQWGLLPAPALPGDVPAPSVAPPRPAPRPGSRATQVANTAKPSTANKRKSAPVSQRLSKPWDRKTTPKLVPPGYE